MGYPPGQPLEENLYAFQRDYQVFPADGTLNDATKAALDKVSDECLSKEDYDRNKLQAMLEATEK